MSDRRFDVVHTDEVSLLSTMLDFHRETIVRKTRGLTEVALRHSPVPTQINLAGLLHHLTRVEEWWFEAVFQGKPFDGYPPNEHQAPDGVLHPQLVERYMTQCETSRRIVRGAQLDDVAASELLKPNLRWLMVHVIEETARHNGHADVLRELLDGATGE